MTRARLAYWLLFAVTLGVYLVMVAWSLPFIAEEAAGLQPFDMRPSGYSTEESIAFLSALSDAGRAMYLGPQHKLDLVYPALLALVLAIPLWVYSAWLPRIVRVAAVVLAGIGMSFDYLENVHVADLLRATGGDVDPDAVSAANLATLIKSGATTVAAIVLLALLVAHIIRRRAGVA